MTRLSTTIGLVLLLAFGLPTGALADDPGPRESLAPAATEDDEGTDPQESEITERMTITATRVQQKLENAPAPLTVLTTEEITDTGAANYADVLRRIPGVNVVQFGARDVNITTRSATSSLAAGQLVLVDNRTIYQDFFGFVMWDFLPVDFDQIKQVEAIRGPGSAVWGANALNGVVNIITKGPEDLQGGSLKLGSGEQGTRYGALTWGEVYGPWGVRLAGSYYEQDAFERPDRKLPSGVILPDFPDRGTEQPKFDALVEYDLGDGGDLAFSAGTAETAGLIQSGIGPFDIDPGTSMSYLQGEWSRGPYRLTLFVNDLDGDALNLLNGLDFAFETTTWNLDFVGSNALSESFRIVYGANGRDNDFDLSIAPLETKREEYGGFVQGEWITGDWRFTLGGRVDRYPDTIGTTYSPRGAIIWEAAPGHTLRVSYSEAFRSPSLVNNFLETSILTSIDISSFCAALGPSAGLVPECAAGVYDLPSDAVGEPELVEESLKQYDLGYTGVWGDLMVTVALFLTETEEIIDFFPSESYSEAAGNIPADWPFLVLGPFMPPFLDIAAAAGSPLPSLFTYRNIAEIEDQGFDITLDWRINPRWNLFASYSWQEDPEVSQTGDDPNFAINLQPSHRAGLGVAYGSERVGWSLNGNYTDEAFWTDVLGPAFWGPTSSYTLFNGQIWVELVPDTLTLTVKGNNITDEDAQQHVYGDIIGRRLIGELRYRF